jgi:hypothetical protein
MQIADGDDIVIGRNRRTRLRLRLALSPPKDRSQHLRETQFQSEPFAYVELWR